MITFQIDHSSLTQLSNLQVLRLQHNQVSSLHKAALSGLTHVQVSCDCWRQVT